MPFKLLTSLSVGNRDSVNTVESTSSELYTQPNSGLLCTKNNLMNSDDNSAAKSDQLYNDVSHLDSPIDDGETPVALTAEPELLPSPIATNPTLSTVDAFSPDIKPNPDRPRLRISRYQDPNRTSIPHFFDTVEAELDDLLVVKLGRPVKSKEEKERERLQQQQGENTEDSINAEGENDAAASAKAEATAQTSGSMTVAQGKNGRTIQYVWFKSKVVSRTHAEIWLKDGHLYIKDNASSSGTFLNRLRLSSSGKESRPYPLKDGDIIQLGIDYQGRPEDVYKSVLMKVNLVNKKAMEKFRTKANPYRFQNALRALLASTNPYANNNNSSLSLNGNGDNARHTVDCCICLSPLSPFQAMFISPCSHCYHYKCIHTLLDKGVMFQCPLCRQVANLNASVSVDSLDETPLDDVIGQPNFGGAAATTNDFSAPASPALPESTTGVLNSEQPSFQIENSTLSRQESVDDEMDL